MTQVRCTGWLGLVSRTMFSIIAIVLFATIILIGFVTRDMRGSKVFLINAAVIALYNLAGWVFISNFLAGGESTEPAVWLIIVTIAHVIISVISYVIYGMIYAAKNQP